MSEHLTTLAVQDAAGETCFFPAVPRILFRTPAGSLHIAAGRNSLKDLWAFSTLQCYTHTSAYHVSGSLWILLSAIARQDSGKQGICSENQGRVCGSKWRDGVLEKPTALLLSIVFTFTQNTATLTKLLTLDMLRLSPQSNSLHQLDVLQFTHFWHYLPRDNIRSQRWKD